MSKTTTTTREYDGEGNLVRETVVVKENTTPEIGPPERPPQAPWKWDLGFYYRHRRIPGELPYVYHTHEGT